MVRQKLGKEFRRVAHKISFLYTNRRRRESHKRDAIAKKTEFNVTNAINNVELEKKAEQEEVSDTTNKKENLSGRRTQPMAKIDNKAPERRVPATSKYKILD